MKIAVYAIALNEAKHVKRFMQACRKADAVFVADTGSTDGTQDLFRKAGATVHQITVKPFRFDDARNASLALVPDDYDICVSLDIDEVPDDGFFDKLRAAWKSDTDRAWVMWDTGSIWANNNRVHARHGFRWIKPCHEVTVLSQRRHENDIIVESIVRHKPDDSKPRSQYLGMLEWAVDEDPRDTRMIAYLAREYYFHQRWEDVIKTVQLLDGLDTGWYVERAASYRNRAFAHQQLGDLAQAEEYFLKGTQAGPDQLEAWFSLSQFYYTQERWQECHDAANKVHTLTPDTHYLADSSTVWRMHDMLALSCWHLGKKGSAKKHARLALEMNPDDDRLKGNLAFIVSDIAKEVQNGMSNRMPDSGL